MNEYGTDQVVADTDEDGLNDGAEVNEHGSDPMVTDTDGGGLNDGAEVNEYETDPTDADSDNDEIENGSDDNPLQHDIYVVIRNKVGCSVSGDDFDGVTEAFETAPVSNPNGEGSINLHCINEGKWRTPGHHVAIFQRDVTTPEGKM